MDYKSTIFREYDIRGIFEQDLHKKSVKLIGYFLGKKIGGSKRVAIGFDARAHSPKLKDWLTSGLNSSGCEVFDMGMVATPVNYFANYQDLSQFNNTLSGEIDGSIMITGSHNPPEYNGFKITIDKKPFFGEDIYALGREIEKSWDLEIEDNLNSTQIDVKSSYIDFMLNEFKELKGLEKELIVDCGNGVAGVVLEDIFNGLELKYKGLYCNPDGNFPNHHPDPSVEENLKDLKEELSKDGDLGFAYDGDGDRVAILTKKHNIKGDQMALIFALGIKNPTVIGEVKCSQVMYDELERRGAKAVMYKTGHSNLKVKMKELNADLACEVSGHIFFKHRYFGFDDAIYATLRMLELVKSGVDLDKEIESLPKVYSTDEMKVETTDEQKFALMDKIKELLQNPPANFPEIVDIITVDGVRINFKDGWGLVRASNTTPLLVTRFESKDKNLVKVYEESINKIIKDAKGKL